MSSSGLIRATEDFVIYLINAADEGILHTIESSSIKIQRAGRGTVTVSGLLAGVAKFIHWQTAPCRLGALELRPLGVLVPMPHTHASCFT